MNAMYQYTADRLRAHEVFSPNVIDTVAETIERISCYRGFGHFFDIVGIDERETLHRGVLDIKPKNYDESSALIVHLPMANPLDGNQVYQVATLSRMFPERRVIAAANPSGLNKSRNQLWDARDRSRVGSGDFRFAVPALTDYLTDRTKVQKNSEFRVDQIGGSLGVDLAIGLAMREIVQIEKQLLIEPASAKKRSFMGLATTFGSTNDSLTKYVEVNNLASFVRVRERQGISMPRYMLGLLRLSNIALTKGIASGTFGQNLECLLTDFKHAPETTVMWGTETEFGSAAIEAELDRVEAAAHTPIRRIKIKGGKHAMINDLALVGAASLQALGKNS